MWDDNDRYAALYYLWKTIITDESDVSTNIVSIDAFFVNADQRAESLTPTSSFSCICAKVNHSLDSVHSAPAFRECELVFRDIFLPDQESLKLL